MAKAWQCTVTFENPDFAPPEVVRLKINSATVSTAAARAIRDARKAVPHRKFESVLVLVESA